MIPNLSRLGPSPRSAPTRLRARSESGSALILALVFLLATGLLTLALATFAVEADTNTTNVRAVGTVNLNAESVATATIEAIRTSYNFPGQPSTTYYPVGAASPTAVACTPTEATTSFLVACIGYATPGTTQSRVVDLYVCATANVASAQACYLSNTAAPGSASSKIALFAEVTYDDIPPGQPASAAACSSLYTATCGMTMIIDHWDVRTADS